jgi:hypothetical protein
MREIPRAQPLWNFVEFGFGGIDVILRTSLVSPMYRYRAACL